MWLHRTRGSCQRCKGKKMGFSRDRKPASPPGRVEVALAEAQAVSRAPRASDKPSGGRERAVCGTQRLVCLQGPVKRWRLQALPPKAC